MTKHTMTASAKREQFSARRHHCGGDRPRCHAHDLTPRFIPGIWPVDERRDEPWVLVAL